MSSQDSELKGLIERLRICCNAQLVAKVNKYYRIKCVHNFSDQKPFAEFDLNLVDGSGWCDWTQNVNNFSKSPDVEFTLQKATLFNLINNSISPMSAYINGQVSISGSVSDAMGLKYLAERAKELQINAL